VPVQTDSHGLPLEPFYRGTNRVVAKSAWYFLVQVGDKQEQAAVLHLKPAFATVVSLCNPLIAGGVLGGQGC
jgi:hypothetical protein